MVGVFNSHIKNRLVCIPQQHSFWGGFITRFLLMSLLYLEVLCSCPTLVRPDRLPNLLFRRCWQLAAHARGNGGRRLKVLAASRGPADKDSPQETADNGSDQRPVAPGPLSAEEVAFRRRAALGLAVAALLALGANFVGITSALLGFDAQLARRLRLDVVYPVKGFKRCTENSKGFEFVYPASWVGDQTLLYRAVERAERERLLDLPPLRGNALLRRAPTEPIVAFGPPGTDGALNVSVVVAPVYPGFRLQLLGAPEDAGRLILSKFIAPEGSGKVATLLTAQKREDPSGTLYYTLEYTVKAPSFFRHNLAVYAANGGLLFSLNSQASEVVWSEVKESFQGIADSFTLTSSDSN